MKRWLGLILFPVAFLFAETETTVSEEGWWHSKQAGRYGEAESPFPEAQWLDAFEFDGLFRTFWIDEAAGAQKTTATAVGGLFGVGTPEVYGASLYASLYVSQRFWGINPSDTGTLNTVPYDDTRGYIYLGEAELRYRYDEFSLRAGRMRLQTPYADEDDIRMAPNTFEGAMLSYEEGEHTALHLLYLTRWAGFDSTDDAGNQSGFKSFGDGSKGTAAAGIVYSPSEKSEYDAWYYRADRLFELGYLEAAGHHYFTPEWHIEWGLQYAQIAQLEASGIEGGVFGAMALLHYRNVYGGAAYNAAEVSAGHFVTDGFGGGPYYTSLDESTIAGISERVPGNDVSVYRIGGGADVAWWPHGEEEGLHLEAVYGRFEVRDSTVAVSESDFLVWLGLGEALRVDAVFANFDITDTPDPAYNDFRRYWVRVDYAF